MFSFNLIYFIIFIINLHGGRPEISDQRLCADENCSEPVSLAKTLLRYHSPDPKILSFAPNSPVKVYSKEAGSVLDLWGVEINGRRGYVPKKMLREHKVLKKPTVLVPTELSKNTEVPVDLEEQTVKPDKVKEPYEVVDGTTVHLNADIDIAPSSTEGPMLYTATSDSNDPQLNGMKIDHKDESNKKEEIIQSDSKEILEEEEENAQKKTMKENTLEPDTGNDKSIIEEIQANQTLDKDNTSTKDSDKENVELKHEETLKPHHNFKTYGLEVNNTGPEQINNEYVSEETSKDTSKVDTAGDINSGVQQESSEENKSENDQKGIADISKSETNTIDPGNNTDNNSEQKSTYTFMPVPTEFPPSHEVPLPVDDYEAATPNLKEIEVKEDEQDEREKENVSSESPDEKTEYQTFSESNSNEVEERKIESGDNLPDVNLGPTESTSSINNTPEDTSVSHSSPEVHEEIEVVEPSTTPKGMEESLQSEQNSSTEETVPSHDVTEDFKPKPDNLPSTPSQIIFSPVLKPPAFPASSEDKPMKEPQQETLDENSSDKIKDEEITEETVEEDAGFFSSLLSFFTSKTEETGLESSHSKYSQPDMSYCSVEDAVCNTKGKSGLFQDVLLSLNSDIFLYLLTTAVSCITFLFLYLAIERSRREGPLIARINKLEKELLVTIKENDLLKEQTFLSPIEMSNVPNEEFDEVKNKLLQADMLREDLEMQIAALQKEVEAKHALELQVESLEKELETSTEIGMELNKIISGMLESTNGSEKLKENVEQLQRQLIEQKDIINTISANLSKKEKENVDLIVELETHKKKSIDLQTRLDDMVQKILDIQKERDDQLDTLQNEIAMYQSKYNDLSIKNEIFNNEIQKLKLQLSEAKKQFEMKTRECETIKENFNGSSPGGEKQLKGIFDAIAMKAEFDQLKAENERYCVELQRVEADKSIQEKQYQVILREIEVLRQKYEQADKEKVESNMKLEVLNSYFKKRETELQEEVLRYKTIWDAKEGEATSTTERIKLLQEEIENYKSQNETLKQEILSQEIDLKSKISMLDQKLHENWVQARQTERKMEDAKQEAAQLRKKLTLRERAITENRLQSPIEQNGDLNFSPHPLESPASPPLLYRTRDHITNSPTLSGLPPFIPPPPGAPFMPPPPIPGMPMPFMPPPPSMYPGDHRPPPLGRMSSPLLKSRYSPDTSAFSPYDRNSPSPPYDSEYGASPPPVRAYSPPYNRDRDDRREFKRPPPPQQHVRSNGRNLKGSIMSSGSDRSNDSLDKINRNQSKMV